MQCSRITLNIRTYSTPAQLNYYIMNGFECNILLSCIKFHLSSYCFRHSQLKFDLFDPISYNRVLLPIAKNRRLSRKKSAFQRCNRIVLSIQSISGTYLSVGNTNEMERRKKRKLGENKIDCKFDVTEISEKKTHRVNFEFPFSLTQNLKSHWF